MTHQKIKLIKNSTILPMKGFPSALTGGVFTSDGEFLEDSIVERGLPRELERPVEYLSGTYIWGGCLFGHFGHFILESLARLYAFRQCKNYPILFINENDSVFHYQKTIFESLGIKNEIIRIKIPTSVENLVYSKPGFVLNPLHIIDEQINALKYFYFQKNGGLNCDKNSKKIWLSRSNILTGAVVNEFPIEKILKKIGYKIVHPENLSLQEQIRLISTSDVVAGFDGSQFYTLLFALDISSKFYIFNRRPKIPEAIPYVLQKRNVEFELHNFDVEYICGEDAWAYHIHSEPEKIIEILRCL